MPLKKERLYHTRSKQSAGKRKDAVRKMKNGVAPKGVTVSSVRHQRNLRQNQRVSDGTTFKKHSYMKGDRRND
jgi:hypothetical protein